MSATPRDNRTKLKRALSWIIKLALSVLLVGLLLAKHKTRQDLAALPAQTVAWVVGGALLYIGSQAINCLKWQLILDAMGHRRGYGQLFVVTLQGMFGNLFVPTAVGGDVLRVTVLAADGVPASIGLLSTLMQRITGFVALLVIGVAGLGFSGELGQARPRQVLVGLAVLLLVLALASLVGWFIEQRFGLASRLPGWLSRPLLRIGAGLRALLANGRTLGWVMLWSFVFQLFHVGLGMLLAQPLAAPAVVRHASWMVPVLSIGGMVPVGLGGVGSREQAANLILRPIVGDAAVTWALLWSAMVLLASLPCGLALAGVRRGETKPRPDSEPTGVARDQHA